MRASLFSASSCMEHIGAPPPSASSGTVIPQDVTFVYGALGPTEIDVGWLLFFIFAAVVVRIIEAVAVMPIIAAWGRAIRRDPKLHVAVSFTSVASGLALALMFMAL